MNTAVGFLNQSFLLEPKSALLDLYKKKLLFNEEFLALDFTGTEIPIVYQVLIEMIRENIAKIKESTVFITDYSKEQILQGAANYLEGNNTQSKYNAKWSEEYVNGDVMYLETERQGMFFSAASIQFQEILSRFYNKASIKNKIEVKWDDETAENFINLFNEFGIYNELKDTIEKHLLFDWSLDAIDNKTIKTNPPVGQKEGSFETDIVNSLKMKVGWEGLDQIAERNLMQGYLQKINESEIKPIELRKYKPDENNEEEMAWYTKALMIDIAADLTVERELVLYGEKYFPGIVDLKELTLRDKSKLPLRETFRVLAFISEFSKYTIKEIDEEYRDGVILHSKTYSTTQNADEIEKRAKVLKGNKEALKEMLSEYYNEDVYLEQRKIIQAAKGSLSLNKCLVKFNYEKLVKTIQWLHQYEADFIRKVIDIFIFDSTLNNDVTRSPFFKMEEDLHWLPNLVAYASFTENLIENLISKGAILIHRLQTDYYEKSLKNLFAKSGYKVISKDENKIFKGTDGRPLGDFDLLAYKEGHLIYMQLKLTNVRNSYYERHNWKEGGLIEAANQLETGIKFINENPEHIKSILGLKESEQIIKIHPFIVGNSYLYDHEKINGFLKISCFEVFLALMFINETTKGAIDNATNFAKLLESNKLFERLEKMSFVSENTYIKFGDYAIIRPGVIQKTEYTTL